MKDGAEGEVAENSQAKGPDSDDTLERARTPTKQPRNADLWGESFR